MAAALKCQHWPARLWKNNAFASMDTARRMPCATGNPDSGSKPGWFAPYPS
ncbi:hypothetical protein DLM_3997 [Aquitalea magnusonii]|uniref:Uncharacterized protein n=1 Tax=Aquitalea magnusonii TaxID=332411 RepID=A0A3G9GUX6_9NEIS|nr:hypothetical protein DLM_3997 [Aquitalea magnusonii]